MSAPLRHASVYAQEQEREELTVHKDGSPGRISHVKFGLVESEPLRRQLKEPGFVSG